MRKLQSLVLAAVTFSNPAPLFAEVNFRELLLVTLANTYSDGVVEEEISIIPAEETGTPPCVPKNGKLVGGYSRGGSTSWVYRLKTSGSSVLAACVDSLKENGFTQEKERGGLVGQSTSAWLCMKDRIVTFSHVRSEGQHYLIETNPAYATDCADFESFMSSPPPAAVPRLETPDGVFSRGGSSSWSGDNFSSTQTLFSVTVSEGLLDHYSDQIVSEGWRLSSRLISDGATLAGFARSIDGESWTLNILNVAVSGGVDVHLFLRSIEKP